MPNNNNFYFLKGGGEMGLAIRETDWSQTILGTPENWPQSLRTSVAMMLENPFGMYIAWGNDYIQLYNDGYRPILGTTKHPHALGISSKITFAEIWHIIGDMFEGVMAGNAVGFPDFMLPLDRNGFVEECYFDFAYSPIRKDDGEVGGILVTVIETTDKKKAIDALQQNEIRFREIANNLPIVVWTASTDGNLTYISNQWEEFYGNPVSKSLGIGWTAFVHPDELENATKLWVNSLQTGIIYETEFRVQHKTDQYRWILVRAIPLKDTNGNIESWTGSNTDIEDKKQAEQALYDSESRFRTMADNIPNLAWMADAEGYIFWYNKQWYDYSGTTPQQMEGWGWQSIHDSAELPRVMQKWQESIATGQPFEMIFPLKGMDGNFRQFLTRVLPVKDDDGNIYQWFGSNTDISSQISAEKSLQESELLVRGVVEGATFFVAVYSGPDFIVRLANQSIIDAWGKGNDVLGKSFKALLPELESQKLFERLDHVYKTGIPFHIENELLSVVVDGEKTSYFYSYSLIPLFDTDGNVTGIVNYGSNVSDLNLAKLKIEERETSLRNMILQAPVAMCILRGSSYIVEIANSKMFELWGKSEIEVSNKPIFDGLPEAREQGLEQLVHQVFTTGERFTANEMPVNLPRNGKIETTYINFVYEAIKEGDGKISGILAVATEVTPQVIARQKIEEVVSERTKDLASANIDLQKSNAELAQFAYIASHDLQEPLRKISIYAQLHENNIANKIDEKSKGYLSKINTAVTRMTTLIRDILAYSELVRDEDVFEKVDLNAIVKNILEDYDLLIEQKGATITYPDLPIIDAIPLQMSQLFVNMIGNALKFANADVKPRITIAISEADDDDLKSITTPAEDKYYKIRFSDNGIGIKPEYINRIFDIFQRLHRKTDFEGTGIGLAMCKKIVINHNGAINAEGSSEAGAVFNVILPAKQKVQSLN